MDDELKDTPTETVVTTEHGVVLTGTHASAFEARVMSTVRKPMYLLAGLMLMMFVLLMGGAVFLNRLSETVHNTDNIVTEVAGPKARAESAAQQKKVLENLLSGMNCQDQRNLQRLVDNLANAGLNELKQVSPIIETKCRVP